MVATIVIPIIFLYFLFVTLSERKKRYEAWLNLNDCKEEAYINGKVIQSISKNEKYVGSQFVTITTLLIKRHLGTVKAVRQTSITASSLSLPIKEGAQIICYGYWDKGLFNFNRFKIVDSKTKGDKHPV